ncbi:MAG: hypothetical protein QW390_02990, partial [Candidatus Bathyarchaeia archaeon]
MKDNLVDKAVEITDAAKKESIVLRIMGALAVRIHSADLVPLHKKLGRELTDIDLIGYRRQEREITAFLERLGYHELKAGVTPGLYASRKIYLTDKGDHIDVFFDKIEMCHSIDFRGRLEADYPTIPLAELVLEKLQIVKINEKDIKDMIILLIGHELGKERDQIDAWTISDLLSRDWCFYYTFTTNLKKVKEYSQKYPELTKDQTNRIADRIDRFLAMIEEAPKTMAWK